MGYQGNYPPSTPLTSSQIATGAVDANALAANAVTTAAIAAGAVVAADLAANSVTTTAIADSNVTIAKLSATGTPSASTFLRGDSTWSTVSASGQLIRAPRLLTSGTSYTTPSNCISIYVELWGAGGSGGRGGSVGGGGGSGAYCAKYATVTPSTAYTIAVGSGGAAPTANNNNGNTGGTTSITIGATTYSATGGTGGSGNPTGGALQANGGNGGTATNGDINISGQYGASGMGSAPANIPIPQPWGQFVTSSTNFNGNGGCTVGSLACPSGGLGNSPGTPTFYGAGSGGVSASTTASAGFQGLIRIWEYT